MIRKFYLPTTCRIAASLSVAVLVGCGNSDASSGPSESTENVGGAAPTGTGGAQSSGGTPMTGVGGTAAGTVASGGSVSVGGFVTTGGVAATGGNAAGGVLSTGGRSNAGGGKSTGGASNAGGAPSTGGTLNAGGTPSTGGTLNAGGTRSTGGAAPGTGGKSNAGGVASTGGTKATGGALSTGGNKNTGGAISTGGLASTGGSKSTSTCTPSSTPFSFFITSRARLFALAQAFNGSAKGFGGDLRYGTSDGLTGADKICTAIAEASMPGNCKTWRAFLSTSSVTAISRVGSGPWYDRLGRVVTTNTAGLLAERPTGANTAIANNLPNEDGTPHHLEETNSSGQAADNHDILTGSNTQGTNYGSTSNCSNWTSSAASTSAKPRVGHSWPTGGGAGGGVGGGGLSNWISCLDESGCAPGYNIIETGAPGNDGTVGSGGGYGAIYCLATNP
jgi:hypothetical protein